jgi:uncharacterized membrane protein
MFAQLVLILTFLAALGSGLLGGLYFAYSNSVMPALAKMPPTQGMAAMNHVNVVIMNPAFLGLFMGIAILSLLLIAAAFLGWTVRPGWVIVGAALCLIGHIAVTMGINVPMNNALAAGVPDSTQAAQLWATFLDRWVFWNNVRALACTGALAAFIVALM